MKLFNKTRGLEIATKVIRATTTYQRMKGLLGKSKMEVGEALWIRSCSSIHTCFMQFPIDVIFVDRQLKVKRVVQNLKPWRPICMALGADSVFELAAGQISIGHISKGDLLDVVD